MYRYLFSIILDIHLGVEFLGHMVILFNVLRYHETDSTADVPFYLPTSNSWGLQFLYILTNTYFFFLFKNIHPRGYLTVVLNCSSLMTNKAEHPTIALWQQSLTHPIRKPGLCLPQRDTNLSKVPVRNWIFVCPPPTIHMLKSCSPVWWH